MHPMVFLFAARTGWFAEGRLLGRVLDEWGVDTQEFLHVKLPHLLVVALIGLVLSRLLRLVTSRMIHIAEEHAPEAGHIAQVKTLAGVIRTTGLAIIGDHRRHAGPGRGRDQSGSAAGLGRGGRSAPSAWRRRISCATC